MMIRRRLVLATLLLALAAPAFAQHAAHVDLVASVKADLQRRGVSIADGCGALEIVKRVAWILRTEGAGLLEKTSGNNCQDRAVDIIAYPDGHVYDILIDSGGNNGPDWRDAGLVELARYRAAVDPGDTPPPIVVPPPAPASDLQAQILAELRAHEAADAAERADAAKFRSEVRSVWKDRMTFLAKYVLPAVGAVIVDRKTKN